MAKEAITTDDASEETLDETSELDNLRAALADAETERDALKKQLEEISNESDDSDALIESLTVENERLREAFPAHRHWPPTTRVYDPLTAKTWTLGEIRRDRRAKRGDIIFLVPLPAVEGE